MVAVGAHIIDKMSPKVNAAEIKVRNTIFNGGTYDQFAQTKLGTGKNYNEIFLTSEDSSHIEPWEYDLDIFTREFNDSNLIGLNRKLQNTPGCDIYLEAESAITSPFNNDLEIIVDNNEELDHRKVIAYDFNDPNTIYEIPKDGNLFWVSLSETTNLVPGEYAHWRVETPALVSGDITDSTGKLGKLDGINDIYDLVAHASMWLDTTSAISNGGNYSWGDLDYSRKNDFGDFAISSGSWLDTSSK